VVDAKTRASMRNASAKFLTDTCTIQRPTTAQDTAGQPIATWADVDTEVPCQLISVSQKRILHDRTADRGEYYETVYQLRFVVGQNVVKGYRITDVVSEDNAFSNAGPIHITSVLPAKAAVAVYLHCDVDYIPGSPA
jgi:hypothetical protein